jgi:hypothetical protein
MAAHIRWSFAKNDGGRETGFHDAGVETFKGNFDRYLAREVIQNSLDARRNFKQPVRVTFELRRLKRKEIPDVDALQSAFSSCAEYWKPDKRAREFFSKAEKLAKQAEVVALQISDYNTSGVLGSDTERGKNWYNLIRCAGSSPKGGGEGGSFGIGKNAPFAASELRTVLYSTHTVGGDNAFQGVAVLASHKAGDGSTAQSTGFLGGGKGASIRTKESIPETFRRDEAGTDIIVLGFPANKNWQEDLTYSVLDNFWLAIDLGDLEVQIDDLLITRKTLPKQLDQFAAKEDFQAHLYFQAFKNPTVPPIKKKLPTLGECEAYLLAGAADNMPKAVAMIRKTGMQIYEKQFRAIVPFCGVFLCRNDQGNSILREMEPPGHDKWDPDLPEKGAHRSTQNEFLAFIRDCIRLLSPADDGKPVSVPGLNKYLPDDEDTPEEEAFDEETDKPQSKESFKQEISKIETKKVEIKKHFKPDSTGLEEGDDEIDIEGDGEGGGGGGGGGGDGGGAKPPIPISYRTFSKDGAAGVYQVRVTPEGTLKSKQLKLQIWTLGDDSRVPAEIKAAKLFEGEELSVGTSGIVGPITIHPNKPIRLQISLQDPLRVSMEVTAHEA